jgi:hypothetical protein
MIAVAEHGDCGITAAAAFQELEAIAHAPKHTLDAAQAAYSHFPTDWSVFFHAETVEIL